MSSNAMLAGVAGLKAHQKMLDVAGNNLANVNTTAFKSSRVTFAEMLSNMVRPASPPTTSLGGTNPQQIGTGVQIATIGRNVTQGNLMNTGQPLDMAIEGSGYFCLSNGQSQVYTRVGTFAVDADFYLVDPNTGFRVRRIGNEGVDEGFQDVSSDYIQIPFNTPLQANETTEISFSGNLSADTTELTTSIFTSVIQYTKDDTVVSDISLHLDELDQASGLVAGDTITVYGHQRDGTELGGGAGVAINLWDGVDFLTVEELLQAVTDIYDVGGVDTSVATMNNGEVRLADVDSGYSLTGMRLEYTGAGSFELPNYFKALSIGGNATHGVNISVFDSLGGKHTLSATFVKSNTANSWDLAIASITGDVYIEDRRIQGMTFLDDGSYAGLDAAFGDTATFQIRYGETGALRTIMADLGSIGGLNGLTQFGADNSTASASGQDGYAYGELTDLSVTNQGVVEGAFSNGIRSALAAICIATFQNPAGLESIGSNYFVVSSNSGIETTSQGQAGGAGSVRGASLEKSNVEVAEEFVNMIQAQNGFQANARTIRVANEMLQELTSLIR